MSALLTRFSRRYALSLWGWYLFGILALAATNLVTLEVPQLAKTIANALADDPNLIQEHGDLQKVALWIMGLGITLMLIRSLSRILIFWPGRRIEAEVKQDLFRKLLRLPLAFYIKSGIGDLVSRISNDTTHLRIFFAFGILQLLNLVFLTIFTVGRMLSVHPGLTAWTLAPLVTMLIITRVAMPRLHKYSRLSQDALGRLTTKVTESFVHTHVIQANAAEDTFVARSEIENDEVYRLNMKVVALRMVIFPLMTALSGVSQLAVLIYGGREVIQGRLSVGDILAFNVYIGYLSFPLTAIGIILSVYQRAITALERIQEVEEQPDETQLTLSTPKEENTSKESPLLEIKNLTFRYGDSQQPMIDHFDLTLESGKKVGLYGPIGSGKSTLFNLVTRLQDPPQGTIYFQGRDICTLSPRTLRASIGYALQSVHLFSDSIENNLVFGITPRPSVAATEQAAKDAQIYDEILKFDHQWQAQIGEKGIRLSGGQKQRLALARLFLRQPHLYILDDVTSALDQRTEQSVVDRIFRTKAAMLIASHRPGALSSCDEILILDQGKIVDRGSFADMVARREDFRQAHLEQSGGHP